MYTLGHLLCPHLSKSIFTDSSEANFLLNTSTHGMLLLPSSLAFIGTRVYKCRRIHKHVHFCLLSILKNSQIVFKHTGYINILETFLQAKYVFQMTVNPDPPASTLPGQELEMYSTTFILHLFLFLFKWETRLLISTENLYYFFQKVVYL